jgi:hypothetical protein
MEDPAKSELLAFIQGHGSEALADALPASPADAERALSGVLARPVAAAKPTRAYALQSFSSLYSAALPFMRAGQDSFYPGEAALLLELASELIEGQSRLGGLVASSDPRSKASDYPYSCKLEADIMARAFLLTSPLDTYESLFSELLEGLLAKGAVSTADAELMRKALPKAEELAFERKVQVLNPLPGMATRGHWRQASGDAEPPSLLGIKTFAHHRLDERPGGLELLAPIMKDLAEGDKLGRLTSESVGLGALSPIVEQLGLEGILGIVLTVEKGEIKKLALAREKGDENAPPPYGPLRAMISLLFAVAGDRPQALASIDMDKWATAAREAGRFFSVSAPGAISVPKSAALALEGRADALNPRENGIASAIETFTFSPAKKNCLLVDPVAVPYSSARDEMETFEATRLCFYCLEPSALTPHHQGAVSLGADLASYEPACLGGAEIAREILNESFSFLTGEYGRDEVAKSQASAFKLLKIKYGACAAVRAAAGSDDLMLEAISGRLGQVSGLSCEVYSLFYQHLADECPAYFAACTHVARLLSDLRTFPQRFSARRYLTSGEES